MRATHIISTNEDWLSARGGGKKGPSPTIFKKTKERTIETIAYCFERK